MARNLFAACRNNGQLVAKRVRLNADVQQAVTDAFRAQEVEFRENIAEEIPFDGSWKPDENEVLTLDVTDEAGIFASAVEANPVSVPDIDTAHFDQEGIKALFTGTTEGGTTCVAIQQFTTRQMLSRRFSLLHDGNAFRRLTDPAFSLDTQITAIIENGVLKFRNFHKMRAIVNLVDIYKEATDQELQNFAGHASFEVGDPALLIASADQTIRKLAHAVMRAGTLDDYTADQIRTAAESVDVPIATNNGRIVLPTDRAGVKSLLRFLDDGLYVASLTGRRYMTNSKRPA